MPPAVPKVWRVEQAVIGSPELLALLDDGWEPFAVSMDRSHFVIFVIVRKLI